MMDEGRHCAVCKRVLEHHVGGDRDYFRHASIDEPADHPPVAIRHSQDPVQPSFRCDFCLDEPITHTMVIDGDLTVQEIGVVYDPEWAMCSVCAELAMDNHWALLQNRAFINFERRFGPMAPPLRDLMGKLYDELRQRLVMYYEEPEKSLS